MKKRIFILIFTVFILSSFLIATYAVEDTNDIPFLEAETGIGAWLQVRNDVTKPGNYWISFNVVDSFDAINFLLFASTGEHAGATGHWALFAYNVDIETTLAGTPLAKENLAPSGDGAIKAEFSQKAPGKYVFYIEFDSDQDPDCYYNVAFAKADYDSNYFECGYNGIYANAEGVDDGNIVLSGSISFVTSDLDAYFIRLDAGVPSTEPQSNPQTGDFILISYGIAALATVLAKKRNL